MELDTALDFAPPSAPGVLVTLKRDGRPQLSNIAYGVGDDGLIRDLGHRWAGQDRQHPPRRPGLAARHRDDFYAYTVIEGEPS